MYEKSNQIIFRICTALVFAIFGGGYFLSSVNAQRLIPYNGYLEQNGVPFDGGLNMFFYLVDNKDQVVEAPSGNGALWWEKHNSVNHIIIHEGRFSVSLGSITPFEAGFFQAHRELYLGIKILINDAWQDLNEKQRIHQVAESIEAQEANDFVVHDRFEVRGRGAVIRGEPMQEDENSYIPLVIQNQDGDEVSQMRVDGDQIQSNGTLQIQTRDKATEIKGDLVVRGDIELRGNFTAFDNYIAKSPDTDGGEDQPGHTAYTLRVDGVDGDGEPATWTEERANMLPSERSMCFLTEVTEGNTNPDASNVTTCKIIERESNGSMHWQLEARILNRYTGYLTCGARCIRW